MASVIRDQELLVPAQALFKAITEFVEYPKFLPEVVSAEIIDASTTQPKVKFELEVVKRFQYILQFKIEGTERISWKLEESNFFKKNEGVWVLKPNGTDKTQVHYELEVGFGFLVPGWISKKLTEVNLPKMFDSFEERAKELS